MKLLPANEYGIGAVSHHNGLSVCKEHGVYQVRGFRDSDGKHVNRGFRTLAEVRKFLLNPSPRY